MKFPTTKSLFAVVACVGICCLSPPAFAVARPNDSAATRAYLRAAKEYVQSEYAEASASIGAIEARVTGVARECPSALTYAPRDAAFEELTETAEMTVVYAGVAAVRPAALRLAHAIAHLSWSSSRLTRLVRSQAVGERRLATLTWPDVCALISAWRASAYATLSPGVAVFIAKMRSIESGVGPSEESLETVIARLLKPYEDPAERQTVKRLERLEARSDRRLTAAITVARTKLAAVLGVSAL